MIFDLNALLMIINTLNSNFLYHTRKHRPGIVPGWLGCRRPTVRPSPTMQMNKGSDHIIPSLSALIPHSAVLQCCAMCNVHALCYIFLHLSGAFLWFGVSLYTRVLVFDNVKSLLTLLHLECYCCVCPMMPHPRYAFSHSACEPKCISSPLLAQHNSGK